VGRARITLGEVDARALTVPAANWDLPLAQALRRRAVLGKIIGNRLLDADANARRRARCTRPAGNHRGWRRRPTPGVTEWCKANQQRVRGATLEQVSAPIRALLSGQPRRRAAPSTA
jgi:hypothetical protein